MKQKRKGPQLRKKEKKLPFVYGSLEQPHPENWQTDIKEDPLPVGPRCIQRFCERLLRRLGSKEQKSLIMFIQRGIFQTGCTHRVLTTSTICSGTDVSVLVATALAGACSSVLGETFHVRHMWSCEKSSEKQDFLKRAFSREELPVIFAEASALAFPRAKDKISGKIHMVAETDIGFAGFPCTDVSSINPKAHTEEHQNVIASEALSTGSVFGNIVKFLHQRPGLRLYFF